ncbi:MAG: RnfABCDGE type electron transport complex subunit D, partial [Bacilli bacterium]|nr:RnfABCDGE type electron transport complex subunit D [Bacilli bacterium]
MENNVYIRSNRSIMSISLTRLVMILPLIVYGVYKNGIYLYRNHLTSTMGMLKPLIIILGGAIIAGIINYLYERFLKKNNSNFLDMIFSSFHIEYAILLGCIMSINVNLGIYFAVLILVLIASKFVDNKINTVCLAFIIIYGISTLLGQFIYTNAYETSKVFSYELIDYLIGRTPGGLASTHIILLVVALIGLAATNNNKTTISMTAISSYLIMMFIYAFITHNNYTDIITCNNFLFLASFIATDSLTSCYTNRAMIISGIIIALL